MPLQWLFDRFRENATDEAVIWRGQSIHYGELLERTQAAQAFLADQRVQPGEAVVIDADYSPGSIALLMATIANRNIVVPIAAHVKSDREKYAEIGEAKWYFKVLPDDRYEAAFICT